MYLFEAGETLEICNTASTEPMHIFMGAATKLQDEPWVKLLGHNGFIIASDEDEADSIMSKISEKGQKFTYKDLN